MITLNRVETVFKDDLADTVFYCVCNFEIPVIFDKLINVFL